MDKIKDVLKSVLHDIEKKQKGKDLDKVLRSWKRIVGAAAYPHTKIVHLTKERIRVNVDSSARLYDLNLKKKHILKELTKALDIKEVAFRLGDVRERSEETYARY